VPNAYLYENKCKKYSLFFIPKAYLDKKKNEQLSQLLMLPKNDEPFKKGFNQSSLLVCGSKDTILFVIRV